MSHFAVCPTNECFSCNTQEGGFTHRGKWQRPQQPLPTHIHATHLRVATTPTVAGSEPLEDPAGRGRAEEEREMIGQLPLYERLQASSRLQPPIKRFSGSYQPTEGPRGASQAGSMHAQCTTEPRYRWRAPFCGALHLEYSTCLRITLA